MYNACVPKQRRILHISFIQDSLFVVYMQIALVIGTKSNRNQLKNIVLQRLESLQSISTLRI